MLGRATDLTTGLGEPRSRKTKNVNYTQGSWPNPSAPLRAPTVRGLINPRLQP